MSRIRSDQVRCYSEGENGAGSETFARKYLFCCGKYDVPHGVLGDGREMYIRTGKSQLGRRNGTSRTDVSHGADEMPGLQYRTARVPARVGGGGGRWNLRLRGRRGRGRGGRRKWERG